MKLAVSPILIFFFFFFYFLHKDGVRGEGLWPDRQFEVNFSVQFSEERVEDICIMSITLGSSSPHQSPERSCWQFRNAENSIYCCPKMSLHWQCGVCFPSWGLEHTQNSTSVFLLTRRALTFCPVVEVCDVSLDILVSDQCHKLLLERGFLE